MSNVCDFMIMYEDLSHSEKEKAILGTTIKGFHQILRQPRLKL